MASPFKIPGNTHRTVVIGRTGSGKSVFAFWLLSQSSVNSYPWLVIDYKREELFDKIHRRAIVEIRPGAAVPRRAGLYITRPRPRIDNDAIDDMLWRIWEKGRTGIFIDEGNRIPDCASLDGIMTQGRSKRIPAIICSQRPVGIAPEIFTQADYFAIFAVQRRDDQITVENYINLPKFYTRYNLPVHSCLWHNVAQDKKLILRPVPPPDRIADELNERTPHRFWW